MWISLFLWSLYKKTSNPKKGCKYCCYSPCSETGGWVRNPCLVCWWFVQWEWPCRTSEQAALCHVVILLLVRSWLRWASGGWRRIQSRIVNRTRMIRSSISKLVLLQQLQQYFVWSFVLYNFLMFQCCRVIPTVRAWRYFLYREV